MRLWHDQTEDSDIELIPPANDTLTESALSDQARAARVGSRRRLFWGMGAQIGAIALRVGQQLIVIPVLLSSWGANLYQDWIIIFSATASLAMLDLGMQFYFGNSLLIAWSRGDTKIYQRHIAIGFGAYFTVLLIAITVLAGSTIFLPWPSILPTHVMMAKDVIWSATLLGLATLVLIPLSVLTGSYRAHGDFGLSTFVSTAADTVRSLAVAAIALLGGSPIDAAILYLAVSLLAWLCVIIDQRRRYGVLDLSIAFPRWKEIREIASKAIPYLAPTMITPVITNGPLLILGSFSPLQDAVVVFVVSRTFTGLVRQIAQQLALGAGGEVGRQFALHDIEGVRGLLLRMGRLVCGATGLLSGAAFVIAGSFIEIWTLGHVASDPMLIAILLGTIILTVPAQVASTIFLFTNKPAILPFATGGYAVVGLVLCALLAPSFSAIGIAMGAGIGEFLTIGLMLPYAACREIRLPFISSMAEWLSIALCAFPIGYGAARALEQFLPLTSLVRIIALGSTWAIVVTLPAFYLLFDAPSRSWIIKKLIQYGQNARRRFFPDRR